MLHCLSCANPLSVDVLEHLSHQVEEVVEVLHPEEFLDPALLGLLVLDPLDDVLPVRRVLEEVLHLLAVRGAQLPDDLEELIAFVLSLEEHLLQHHLQQNAPCGLSHNQTHPRLTPDVDRRRVVRVRQDQLRRPVVLCDHVRRVQRRLKQL